MIRSHFRTPKGTELPLMNLRGKEYLIVQYRVVWFREERPDWSIETEFLQLTSEIAIARAFIKNEQGRIIAMGTKHETPKGFPDFIEKSESSAIGRALAMCGFGTQFCADDLDEGEGARLADSPVESKSAPRDDFDRQHQKPTAAEILGFQVPAAVKARQESTIGEFVIKFGKHKGLSLKTVGWTDCNAYLNWLESNAKQNGKPLNNGAIEFKQALLEWGGK